MYTNVVAMSNNSWKQYGGINKFNNFNTINASTIIADQFVSRSSKPTYQYLNGTFEVSLDLSAGVNVLSGNSMYSNRDIFVNRDVYTNNKLFFGNNTFQNDGNNFPALASDTTHAYIYGDSNNIGMNTTTPKTVFNITGTIDSVTDILTVESSNVNVRNIIAQNKNQHGIVVDANDVRSNIHFYNDVSTNKNNIPDATIQYQDGGTLKAQTTNHIVTSSRKVQFDNSGGNLIMDASGTFLTTTGEIELQTDRSYILNSAKAQILLDQTTGNMQLDTSNNFILNCSGATFQLNDDSTIVQSVGDIALKSTGNTGIGGNILFDTNGGNIDFNSGDIKLNTLLKFAPPERGVSSELLHDETISIYDNANHQFLPNVYNDTTILTGNAATFIGKDFSSNTFIYMNPAANKLGSALGGGMAPHDSTRAMSMLGLTDKTGSYIPSQMTVSSSNKDKYVSTLGINTYKPRTEQYVFDVNGPIHIGNGEINTLAAHNYEIKDMHFSKTHPNSGIAVGSPSTKFGTDSDENSDTYGEPVAKYKQDLLFTHDGGKSWSLSDPLLTTSTSEDFEIIFNHVHVFDSSYGVITTDDYLFITTNGGINWLRLQPNNSDINTFQTSTIVGKNIDNTHRIFISYDNNVGYVDVQLSDFASNTTVIETAILGINPLTINIGSASDYTANYIYYAGENGVYKYDFVNVNNNTSTSKKSDKSYHDIYAYDDSHVIAVGNNRISYTVNGDNWNDIVGSQPGVDLTNVNLLSVFIYSLDYAVAVGSKGEFMYSTDWRNGVWQIVPYNLLNSSGTGDRISGVENKLNSISMTDINTFIIADTTTEYTNSQLGYSKMQYCFLPNLFNRTNNTVIDVSGNMVISGDIEVFDGELLVNTIDYKPINALDMSGTIDIGTKTHVVNIGKTDSRSVIEGNRGGFDNYASVINIGVVDPPQSDSPQKVLVNIASHSNTLDLTRPSNKINIGGGKDKIVISGEVEYTDTKIQSSKNKGIQINDFNIHDGIKAYLTVEFDNAGFNFEFDSTTLSNQSVLDKADDYTIEIDGITIDSDDDKYKFDMTPYKDITGDAIDDIDSAVAKYLLKDYASTGNPMNSAGGAGLFITDNLDRGAGYLKVSQDMSGWVMKPTHIGSNSIKFDVNSLIIRDTGYSETTDVSGVDDIHNGIVVLTKTVGESDCSYTLTVKQVDISNILIRDSKQSNNSKQVINTELQLDGDIVMNQNLLVKEDVSFNNRLYVKETAVLNNDVSMNKRLFVNGDVSFNDNLYVHGDVSFNGNMDISGILRATHTTNQTNYIISTVTNNYEFIVTTDMSMSGDLFVGEDASFNGNMDISGYVAIGKHQPVVALDISYTDAIRIPVGKTSERPINRVNGNLQVGGTDIDDTIKNKYIGSIRYNKENSQFEGFGPGDSWGSLGGVINVAQNTKIIASSPNADSTNNDLMFFTASKDNKVIGDSLERMRIDGSGNVGVGTVAPECNFHVDISNNPEQTYLTSMFTNTSLKSMKNSDLERYVYANLSTLISNYSGLDDDNLPTGVTGDTTNGYTYDFKEKNEALESTYITQYINNRTFSYSNLPFGVTDNGGNGDDYIYAFDKTNLDLEQYVNSNLPTLINDYTGPLNGVSGSSTADYTYDFDTNNIYIEYHFIKDYVDNRTFSDSKLPFGVTSNSSSGYRYDFVKSIVTVLGKNIDGSNNSTEIKYWHIDDLSTSNALSFGFTENSDKMFIRADGNVGIGTINPNIILDVSGTDAIRIPVGGGDQRPIQNGEDDINVLNKYIGCIRYHSTNMQFEGFGPGNAWGSLGGVINVAQNTKITAESFPAGTNNELRFYTAYHDEITDVSAARLQMIIDVSSGGVAIGTGYATDVSNGSVDNPCDIDEDSLIVEGKVGIGTKAPTSILDVSGTMNVTGATVIENTLDVSGNVNVHTDKFQVTATTGNVHTKGTLDVSGATVIDGKLSVKNIISIDKPNSLTSRAFPAGNWLELNHDTYNNSIGSNYSGQIYECGVHMANNDGSNQTEQWGMFMGVKKPNMSSSNTSLSLDLGSTYYNTAAGTHGDGDNYTITTGLSIDTGGNVTATSYNATSDIRHKENVHDLENALEKIKGIRGVSFNFKRDDKIHSGIIAQEVAKIIPEAICKSDNEKWSANYNTFIGYLIESVKTLSKENEQLKEKVNTLETKVEMIMKHLNL